MFGSGGGLKIGSIRGIPVRLDYSWIFFAALIGLTEYENRSGPGGEEGSALLLAGLYVVLWFLMVFVHEVAHGFTGRRLGVPVQSITLTFWGGYTRFDEESERPSQQFLISASGPVASVLFGLLLLSLGRIVGGLHLPDILTGIGWWSMIIGGLNALPGFPLDGGHMLRAIVWGASKKKSLGTTVAGFTGQLIAGCVIVYGIYRFSENDTFGGIWFVFIGVMLFGAAWQAVVGERTRTKMEGATVAEAMGPPPSAIPADISLSDALDLHLRAEPDATFPVVDSSAHLIGLLTLASASAVGQQDPLRPVRDAVLPLDGLLAVDAASPLQDCAKLLSTQGQHSSALVFRDGALAGMITLSDIARWANEYRSRGIQDRPIP